MHLFHLFTIGFRYFSKSFSPTFFVYSQHVVVLILFVCFCFVLFCSFSVWFCFVHRHSQQSETMLPRCIPLDFRSLKLSRADERKLSEKGKKFGWAHTSVRCNYHKLYIKCKYFTLRCKFVFFFVRFFNGLNWINIYLHVSAKFVSRCNDDELTVSSPSFLLLVNPENMNFLKIFFGEWDFSTNGNRSLFRLISRISLISWHGKSVAHSANIVHIEKFPVPEQEKG